MLQKYVITHSPSGQSVTVKAYTPEQAHTLGMQQLQKVVGVAVPVNATPAQITAAGRNPQPSPHPNNTIVAVASTGTVVTSKLTTKK